MKLSSYKPEAHRDSQDTMTAPVLRSLVAPKGAGGFPQIPSPQAAFPQDNQICRGHVRAHVIGPQHALVSLVHLQHVLRACHTCTRMPEADLAVWRKYSLRSIIVYYII